MISLIVAIAKNNVIGKGNKLPWHYKEDMEYFKKTTWGKTVIMGEATFRSIEGYIGKPLPGRTSVVASLDNFTYPGIEVTSDIVSYLKSVPKDKEVFIIGGKVIYDLTLNLADRLYITHIDKAYEGDVYFKEIDYSKYDIIKDEQHGELRFVVYERRS
jgi:dihydrofolate reductase